VSDFRVEPLGPENVGAWTALFERASSHCFCRWWHFGGTKNEWLARCAMDSDANRAEAEASLQARTDDALGLVAFRESAAVGWMKLSPRAAVPKLRKLPIYRSVDLGADEGVWSIGCFLIDPTERQHGVAGALLDAAPAFVRARGGHAIEGYPKHVHESAHARLHDEEALMGPEALFTSRGFTRVAEEQTTKMYPVYRLTLEQAPG
jgi:GNAT superfamily N-acetyltransferase